MCNLNSLLAHNFNYVFRKLTFLQWQVANHNTRQDAGVTITIIKIISIRISSAPWRLSRLIRIQMCGADGRRHHTNSFHFIFLYRHKNDCFEFPLNLNIIFISLAEWLAAGCCVSSHGQTKRHARTAKCKIALDYTDFVIQNGDYYCSCYFNFISHSRLHIPFNGPPHRLF